jgi:hypothetical protein
MDANRARQAAPTLTRSVREFFSKSSANDRVVQLSPHFCRVDSGGLEAQQEHLPVNGPHARRHLLDDGCGKSRPELISAFVLPGVEPDCVPLRRLSLELRPCTRRAATRRMMSSPADGRRMVTRQEPADGREEEPVSPRHRGSFTSSPSITTVTGHIERWPSCRPAWHVRRCHHQRSGARHVSIVAILSVVLVREYVLAA